MMIMLNLLLNILLTQHTALFRWSSQNFTTIWMTQGILYTAYILSNAIFEILQRRRTTP